MPEWLVWPSRRTVPVSVPVSGVVGDLPQAQSNSNMGIVRYFIFIGYLIRIKEKG